MKRKPPSTPRAYFELAAKQFAWPIDFDEKLIFVPEDDLEYAERDLMVQHFRGHGWHVQSCISVEYTKVFVKPITPGPIFRGDLKRHIDEPEQVFKCNQKFKTSTDTVLQIVEITKKSITLAYIGVKKDNVVTTAENLQKSVKMGVFVRV